MRKIMWLIAIVVCTAIFIVGCGKKDAATIVKDLDQLTGKMASYQGSGTMMIQTGQQPQEYQVEVWFKGPHYYRILLSNAKKDITQIVLRNDDGVFVLTPHLNKSFRFQSDWPENQGQVYLFQTLVRSIINDKQRQFAVESDAYVFNVLANYQNSTLSRQKIWLDKKTYAPQHVEISDANSNVVVIVKFDKFEFNKKFDKDSFDMQRNMTSMLPTGTNQSNDAFAGIDNKSTTAGQQDSSASKQGSNASKQDSSASKQVSSTSKQDSSASKQVSSTSKQDSSASKQGSSTSNAAVSKIQFADSFGVIEPAYTPDGVQLKNVSDNKKQKDSSVLLRYTGKYNYTLWESRPVDQAISGLSGQIVDLGFTIGDMTGDKNKTLTWTFDGLEFRISSGDLPESEMALVAQSLQDQIGK